MSPEEEWQWQEFDPGTDETVYVAHHATDSSIERAELAKLCNPEGSPIYSVTGTSSVMPPVETTPENDRGVETGEPGEPPDDIPWRADYRHRYMYVDATVCGRH